MTTVAANGPRQFALTSSGMAYELANDGTASQISTTGTVNLDTGVDVIGVAGNNLLDLENNGRLYTYGAGSWQLLDVGVATFQADANGNVAILESNGTLRMYPAGGPLTLTPVATSVRAIAVTAAGTVYFLDNGGNLSQDGGNLSQDIDGTISLVASSVQSFQVDAAGNRYELLRNNTLEENENAAQPLASNVVSFQVSGTGVVTDLQSAANWAPVLEQAGATVAAGVSSFAVAPDGTLYYLTAAGLLKQGSATPLDANVSSFTLASDGTLYELQQATLFQRSGATRTQLDDGVGSIAVSDNGALYDLESSGALYEHTVDGWQFLDTGVAKSLSPTGGALLDLEATGVLYQHTKAGWARLDGGVTALTLAPDGFTPLVTIGNASPTPLPNITTQLNNSSILDDLFSDGSLWQDSGGLWTMLDSGVKQIGLTANGTLVDLEGNGTLYSHTSQWSMLASNVDYFTIASGSNVIMAIKTIPL
jgi:hypothetical protein